MVSVCVRESGGGFCQCELAVTELTLAAVIASFFFLFFSFFFFFAVNEFHLHLIKNYATPTARHIRVQQHRFSNEHFNFKLLDLYFELNQEPKYKYYPYAMEGKHSPMKTFIWR